jgi:hypothetical protein
LNARFANQSTGTRSFEFKGHRWAYRYSHFDDNGDYDLLYRPVKVAAQERGQAVPEVRVGERSDPGAPPAPAAAPVYDETAPPIWEELAAIGKQAPAVAAPGFHIHTSNDKDRNLAAPEQPSAEATESVQAALQQSLLSGYLFGKYDEPLNDYGRRLVRVILLYLNSTKIAAPQAGQIVAAAPSQEGHAAGPAVAAPEGMPEEPMRLGWGEHGLIGHWPEKLDNGFVSSSYYNAIRAYAERLVARLAAVQTERDAALDECGISRHYSLDAGETWIDYTVAERLKLLVGTVKDYQMEEKDISDTDPV